MKRPKIFGRLLFILNWFVAISGLLSYASPYIKPSVFWPISFFGLALPYFIILNAIFLLLWTFKGSSRMILSLLVLCLGYKSLPAFIQADLKSEQPTKEHLKLMSFNVRIFDLYMWTEDKSTRNNILDFLKEEDPDILCLQEFYHRDIQSPRYEFKTLDTLVKILSAKNYHVNYTTTLRDVDHWGVITFSKYPIVNKGKVPFAYQDDNVCIYSDIKKGADTIRVFNAHLASIKLDKRDYRALQEINKNEYSENFDNELKMLSKIKYGFFRRSGQADSIRKVIGNTPLPVVLCGDFNDTPASYAYQRIKGNLKDAFIESGSGLGRTYIGKFPSFRIDYILASDEFSFADYTTFDKNLSDHRPIGVHLKLN